MIARIFLVILVAAFCVKCNAENSPTTSCRRSVCKRRVEDPCRGALATMTANASASLTDLKAEKTKLNVCLEKCEFNKRDFSAGVILRRQDGSVDFNRSWADYRCGFGDLNGELWLGLEKIHQLTTSGAYSIMINLTDMNGNKVWAQYSSFIVTGEEDNFRLNVSGYNPASSTKKEGLGYSNGVPFSAYDRDNDLEVTQNCAQEYVAGWWFKKCYTALPTGRYSPNNIKWWPAFADWRKFRTVTLTLTPT